MMDFQYKSLIEQRKMAMEELQEYFRLLRKVEYERQTLYDIKIRKRIYWLVKFLLKVNRLMEHHSIKVVGDKRYQANKGRVYVCTSSSEFDVPSMFEVVKEPSWTVVNEVGSDFNKSLDLLLRMNFLTTKENLGQEDLKVIENRLFKNLAVGGCEICFPEKVSLRSSEDTVAPLDEGFVKRVSETKASVIPVAIMERGKDVTLINVGKNIEFGYVEPRLYGEVEAIVRNDLNLLKEEMIAKELKKKKKKLD